MASANSHTSIHSFFRPNTTKHGPIGLCVDLTTTTQRGTIARSRSKNKKWSLLFVPGAVMWSPIIELGKTNVWGKYFATNLPHLVKLGIKSVLVVPQKFHCHVGPMLSQNHQHTGIVLIKYGPKSASNDHVIWAPIGNSGSQYYLQTTIKLCIIIVVSVRTLINQAPLDPVPGLQP